MENNKKTQGIISFLGNSLEFYEFTIYGIFSTLFATLFFPNANPFISIMSSWAAFAVGFIMRPLGAVLFGHIGDKYGRRKALLYSILTMSLATIAIGCLPSYTTIGIAAPILLLLLRMLQGVSTGGEYNGAAIFLIEKIGSKKPGLVGGIITSSCVFGAILGTIFGKYLLNLGGEYWRLAFLIGGLGGLIIYASRFLLKETAAFINQPQAVNISFLEVINTFRLSVFKNMLLGGLNGALSYFLFGFSIIYLSKYIGFSMEEAVVLNIVGLLFFFVFSMLMGYLYDLLGSQAYKSFMILLLFVIPITSIYCLLSFNFTVSLLGIIMWGILTGAIAGPGHAILQENVPVIVRYRLVAFSFSLGMGLAGGLTPAIMTYLIEKHDIIYAPAIWIMTLSFGLAVMYGTNKVFQNRKEIKIHQ